MAAEAPLVSYISKDQMLQVKNIAIAARSLVFARDVGQNRCGPTCSVQGWTICKLQWQGGCLAAQVRRQALAHTQRMSSDSRVGGWEKNFSLSPTLQAACDVQRVLIKHCVIKACGVIIAK